MSGTEQHALACCGVEQPAGAESASGRTAGRGWGRRAQALEGTWVGEGRDLGSMAEGGA